MNDPILNDRLIISTYVDQTLTLPGGGIPPREPGYVFGTVNHRGTTTWERLHRAQNLLLEGLVDRGIEAMAAYAVGAMRSFVEPVVYTLDLDHDWALDIARSIRHRYLLARDTMSMQLLEVRSGISVADVPYRFLEETGVCVMPNSEPEEVCVMRGGPFGSEAISASLDWKWERQRLVAALGCVTCNQGEFFRMLAPGAEGKMFAGGGPVALVPHEAPTRYTTLLEVTGA